MFCNNYKINASNNYFCIERFFCNNLGRAVKCRLSHVSNFGTEVTCCFLCALPPEDEKRQAKTRHKRGSKQKEKEQQAGKENEKKETTGAFTSMGELRKTKNKKNSVSSLSSQKKGWKELTEFSPLSSLRTRKFTKFGAPSSALRNCIWPNYFSTWIP